MFIDELFKVNLVTMACMAIGHVFWKQQYKLYGDANVHRVTPHKMN